MDNLNIKHDLEFWAYKLEYGWKQVIVPELNSLLQSAAGDGRLLLVAAVGAVALIGAYLLFKKCFQQTHLETDLAKIHYYAGCTPCKNTTQACIELLEKSPHLVNTPLWKNSGISHGYTPFLRACWNNNYTLIDFMLKIGADIRISNVDGETALYLVAYRVSKSSSWDSRALRLLWEKGCSVDAVNVNNNSMLHLAAKSGNATLTRWLLLHGADPDVSNACGYTPYALALKKGSPAHIAVANLLHHPNDSTSQCRVAPRTQGVEFIVHRSISSPVTGRYDSVMQ